MKLVKNLVAGALLAAGVMSANAATLDTGLVQMGVDASGGLGSGSVGLVGVAGDAIMPGCLCEGWGASASGIDGFVYGLGTSGFTSSALTVTDASGSDLSAQSVVVMGNGLTVTHDYSYAAGGVLFGVKVTMTNTTAGTLTDVRYARTLDWDVPPGHFSDDFTTVYGGTPSGPGGVVKHTSTDPFTSSSPLVLPGQNANTNVVDAPGDLGSYFMFGFGDLAAGSSVTFDTFIGAGRDLAQLIAAFTSVGIEAYSYTYDNDTPATYGYGFRGLGLPPSFDVPEPGSLALAGLALLGLGGMRRRKAD